MWEFELSPHVCCYRRVEMAHFHTSIATNMASQPIIWSLTTAQEQISQTNAMYVAVDSVQAVTRWVTCLVSDKMNFGN